MKEITKRYTNPFLSDEENEKLNLWKQELDCSNIEDDSTNNCVNDKLINSLAPSKAELYTDKDVLECEEAAFHVKDICVDEGEKILFDESNNEMVKPDLLRFSTMNIGDNRNRDEGIVRKSGAVDVGVPVNEPINDHGGNIGSKSIDTKMVVQDIQKSIPDYKECGSKEEVIDSNVPNEQNEMFKSDRLLFTLQSDSVSKTVDDNGLDISLQPGEEQISSSGITSSQQDRPLPSLNSLLESIDQQHCQSFEENISKKPVENKTTIEGNTSSNLNNVEPATSGEDHNIENPERVNKLSIEPHVVPRLQDGGSVNGPMVNPVHRSGEAEPSLSVAGPVSGLVTCSGLIGFSGSTSLRSDSSTTSTQSFAFPILQNEWNSSPVRMAKADRRGLRKHHREWRHRFLCFRF